jgi:hypothetical protein
LIGGGLAYVQLGATVFLIAALVILMASFLAFFIEPSNSKA